MMWNRASRSNTVVVIVMCCALLLGCGIHHSAPPNASFSTAIPPFPTPSPTRIPPFPGLDPNSIIIEVTVDYQGILNNLPAAVAVAERQVRANTLLEGKRAGLVLTYGGSAGQSPDFGGQVAKAFDVNVLRDLGNQGYVFINTIYREFHDLSQDPSIIVCEIFVYE